MLPKKSKIKNTKSMTRNLGRNPLTGTLPTQLGNLEQLRIL